MADCWVLVCTTFAVVHGIIFQTMKWLAKLKTELRIGSELIQ